MPTILASPWQFKLEEGAVHVVTLPILASWLILNSGNENDGHVHTGYYELQDLYMKSRFSGIIAM